MITDIQEQILDEVIDERRQQDDRWGPSNHSVPEWIMILGEELGECSKAALEAHFMGNSTPGDYTNLRKELIQSAAVIIAFIESLERNELKQK